MNQQQVGILIAIMLAGFIPVMLVVVIRRRARAILEVLRQAATAAGWTGFRNTFFAGTGLKGTWRSLPVELSYFARGRGVPERLILKVRATSGATLIVKRKYFGLFSNRPFTFFGPPLIEVRNPTAAALWIRGEPALAERLFADTAIPEMISSNLVARFDEIRVNHRGLRIVRAIDDGAVRAKYGIPAFSWHVDAARYEPIVREQLALAQVLIERLSFRA